MFEVAASANGVTYAPSSPIATPLSQSASSQTGGASETSTPNGAVQFLPAKPLMVACAAVVLSAVFGAWSVL